MVEDQYYMLAHSTLTEMLDQARWSGKDAEELISEFTGMGEIDEVEMAAA